MIFPLALEGEELAGLDRIACRPAVDRHHSVSPGPFGNPNIHRECLGPAQGKFELRCVAPGIFSALSERALSIVLCPRDSRRDKQINVDSVVTLVIGTDAIIGGQLRERPRATRPFVAVVDLAAVVVVVRIIEACSIGKNWISPGDSVVQHALHAVAVSRIARHPQQITSDLEVAVGAARGLKAGMSSAQTCV